MTDSLWQISERIGNDVSEPISTRYDETMSSESEDHDVNEIGSLDENSDAAMLVFRRPQLLPQDPSTSFAQLSDAQLSSTTAEFELDVVSLSLS